MAFFGVTKEKIAEVREHTNADRLSIAKLEGMDFQFVILKDQFKVGDNVLYFPLDSLIPQEILKKLGLEGKLSGKNRNRVKTIRLRGELSQGIVSDLNLIEGLTDHSTEAITGYLNVTKYEPPIVPCNAGLLIGLPQGQSTYDIEGADRYVDVLNKMMDMDVTITEKIEGSNWSITKTEMDEILVNQRNHSIKEIEGKTHDFWKVARKHRLISLIKSLPYSRIEIYGEIIGPGTQKNYYGVNDHIVKVFDVRINYKFIPGKEFLEFVKKYLDSELVVPIIEEKVKLRDYLDNSTIQDKSNGVSKLIDKPREGIVIKPYEKEERDDKIGRLILKQRSPEYLLKE